MRHAILTAGLVLAACSGVAFAQSEVTRTTTTTTTLSPEEQTTVHEYISHDTHQSIHADNFNVAVGAVVPPSVTFYEVPHVDRYRYTIVNDHRVVVDPTTRRIIEVER